MIQVLFYLKSKVFLFLKKVIIKSINEFINEIEKTKFELISKNLKISIDNQNRKNNEIFQFEKPKSLYPKNYNSATIKNNIRKKSILNENFVGSKVSRSVSNFDIIEWPSLEIARQITIIEFNIFQKIHPKECLNQGFFFFNLNRYYNFFYFLKVNKFLKKAWNKEGKEDAINLKSIINNSNIIANWVTFEIIKNDNIKIRQKYLLKFIKVAIKCKNIGNFNALYEICIGLNSIPVFRLKKFIFFFN
jgi:hypothetical protein